MRKDVFRERLEAPLREAGERPRLLALEEHLRNDADGRYRRDLLDRLQAARAELRRQLDRGVSPEVYRQLSRIMEAYEAAYAVIEETRI